MLIVAVIYKIKLHATVQYEHSWWTEDFPFSHGSGIQVPYTLLLHYLLGSQGPLNSVDREIEGEESILASHLLHPRPDTQHFYSHFTSKD